MKLFLYLSFLFLLLSCSPDATETSDSSSLGYQVSWSLDSIATVPNAMTYATFRIKNLKDEEHAPGSWSIHYNQLGGRPDDDHIPASVSFENPSGGYLIATMNQALPANGEISFSYGIGGHLDKMSETPKGAFVVHNGTPSASLPVDIIGMNTTTLAALNPTTPLTRYEEYKNLSLLSEQELHPFIPSPVKYTAQNKQLTLSKKVTWSIPAEMSHVQSSINDHQAWLGSTFDWSDSNPDVHVTIDAELVDIPEGYAMKIWDNGVEIIGADVSGAFYGMQSLLQMMYYGLDKSGNFVLQHADIQDYPRFGYRGFNLDISRNYHSISAAKKILDMMAMFKLNKFHLHLTDDEGWRLEIPGLPELTEYGSKRGYTVDEKDHLYPAYGSGPDPEGIQGSGYYTKEQFKDLLQYAKARHIEVIPEIDLPGHARAAIKSMQVRYDKYMEENRPDLANQYLLHDAKDQSTYNSAQGYNDNVICVCQDGAINFVDKVLSELILMFDEAEVELNYLHIGGDEIPAGAWEKSPVCADFIAKNPSLGSTADLPMYIFNKMKDILEKRDITMAGWEEIMLAHDKDGHNTTNINPAMIDGRTLPYVWNAVWGWGREDMIYRLANAGSPVVMANSAAFYFDMAYDRAPDEIGLSWSGFSDGKTAYAMDPLDMFKMAKVDKNGAPLKADVIGAMTRLSEEGRKNFLGIQAQLWSETVVEEKWLDYLMYPKMFAFSERAWSQPGAWMNYDLQDQSDLSFDQNWNKFANTVGQRGFGMLDLVHGGIGYRTPRIGKNEKGETNIQYPGYGKGR